MADDASKLQHTSLYARHLAAGAKLVPFSGWAMPVQYAGVLEEHRAVRSGAGVFDVSHMGEVETEGPDALAFLQRVLSNDVARMDVGAAQYSLLCREDGGVLDDLFTYRLAAERYLTVTNAANHEKDLAWLQEQAADFDVELRDVAADYAMLAVQGPRARELVQGMTGQPLPPRFAAGARDLDGIAALVCGTGYTGEDGVELLVAPGDATVLWDRLGLLGVAPIGLAARDTLRLEVCFHLYGNDLMDSRGPIEAGLGWACKEDTGFIGSEAVRAVREAGPSEKLVPFVMTAGGIARQGNPVVGGGEVTSGTMGPSLGVGIGMAYVPAERASVGSPLAIDVRGKQRPAEVHAKPLYTKETSP